MKLYQKIEFNLNFDNFKANKIFETIRWTLNKTLSTTDWMDDSTRFNAIHKIKSINKFIGYSDQLIDQNTIDQFYFEVG